MLIITYNCLGQNVIIKQKNGNESIISLDSNPIITFNDEEMIIESTSSSFVFKLADVLEYGIDETTEIKGLNTKPQISNGKITLTGYPINTAVIIAALDGKILLKDKIGTNGEFYIELNNLPKGVFIIKVAEVSMKVINK